MSESAIRARIKAMLETVDGIGQVYDYNRYSRSWAKQLELMRDSTGNLLGWEITRVSVSQKRATMPSLYRLHTYKIYGIMDVDDANASEKTFQALVDDIADAYNNDPTLDGNSLNSDPLQVNRIGYSTFGDTLYHTADITIVVHERISYTA